MISSLFPRQGIALARAGGRFVLPPTVIHPQTSELEVRIARPTTLNPRAWGNADKLAIALVVEMDGEEYRCDGGVTGGIVMGRGRVDIPEYVLSWTLPWGFFDVKAGLPVRLGERSKTAYRSRIEVTSLSGKINSDIIVNAVQAEAPRTPFHSSVAFDTATSVLEISGDGVVSTSHTASGSNRAAFVASGVEANAGTPTNFTHTYGGNAPTANIWNGQAQNASQWAKGDCYVEALVPASAQTVQSVSNGPSAWNAHGMGVITMTGVDQTTPVGAPETQKAAFGTTPSVTVGGVGVDDLVVDAIFGFAASGGFTAGANQTDRWAKQTGSTCLSGSTQLGSDGGVMSWSKNIDFEFRTDAVAFKPGAAPPVSTPSLEESGYFPSEPQTNPTVVSSW